MKEIKLFFTALMFITRIPVPSWVGYSEANLNKCNRYFPLVGIIVGAGGALVYWASSFLFPNSISILLSMVSTVLLTGAFHEDGFADVCDGFGGGWTTEKILEIMKDSRVGAYGMIGMILLLMLKFLALSSLPQAYVIPALIAGHSISRTFAVSTMYNLPYVREDELSKVKPVTKNLHITDLWIAIIIGLASFLFFMNWQVFFIIIPLIITKIWLEKYFKKWIGGYVGDCLGTMQQVTEVVFYLSIIALSAILTMI
ncbi:adenosylcobinamide-GDP ribazoletransferase [Labilibacter marinus]|uniref:adenosylcobinamide-GDP ribazoletransferase n=1 Tax=Labilibacter marinus TaxID=1477105 RepID=UPI00094FDEAF|nr:adenosylcobinamide-GDP ribazoletransferase [Labilibacter marinus]